MLPIKKTLDSEVTAGYNCTKLYKKRFLWPNRSAGSQIPNVMDNPCYKTSSVLEAEAEAEAEAVEAALF